jgi:hypothetical protein
LTYTTSEERPLPMQQAYSYMLQNLSIMRALLFACVPTPFLQLVSNHFSFRDQWRYLF